METDSIVQLVLAGEYREAARHVQEALAAERDGSSPVETPLLADALGIVQLCLHSCTEAGWHRSCVERSEEHERSLRKQLFGLLEAIKLSRANVGARRGADVASPAPDESPGGEALTSCLLPALRPEWFAGAWPGEHAPVALVDRQGAQPHAGCAATLDVYCLGPFRAFIDDQLVTEWPNGKSKSVFKYLVTHRARPVTREVLMETFWPNADPDAARNNLNVAIYGLRKLLARVHGGCSYVLFQDGCYLLNPALTVWVDADAFVKHCRNGESLEFRGEREAAMAEHRAAEAIYQSEFLAEDRYEDWVMEKRQTLQELYLAALYRLSEHYLQQQDYDGCARICKAMLLVDGCNEEAHRRLMRCYCRLGQTHLAVRQYHFCVEALARRVQLSPSVETVELLRKIRQRAFV